MNRQQLQAALKEFRNQGLTNVSLTAKTEILQAEYNAITESEKQHIVSFTVQYENEFIKVTSTGLRGKTLISNFVDGVVSVEDLINSGYITTEVLTTIETTEEAESEEIWIGSVKTSNLSTQELANEMILLDGIEKTEGYNELETKLFQGDLSDRTRKQILNLLYQYIKAGDECFAA